MRHKHLKKRLNIKRKGSHIKGAHHLAYQRKRMHRVFLHERYNGIVKVGVPYVKAPTGCHMMDFWRTVISGMTKEEKKQVPFMLNERLEFAYKIY